jgi:hypothetical protein
MELEPRAQALRVQSAIRGRKYIHRLCGSQQSERAATPQLNLGRALAEAGTSCQALSFLVSFLVLTPDCYLT